MALKMDADNVEGLVARGALYANGGSLEKVSTTTYVVVVGQVSCFWMDKIKDSVKILII